jgi:non-ribosomal peptide synthetase component F
MTVLAGWQALLGFYSGQRDVVVGTDIANRTRAEAEPLIGFFVNQLVLRTDLSGDPTFAELLRRVREVTLGAYAHQEVPFEKVVEALNPERSLSQTPLFQVKLVLQNAPMSQLHLPGLTFSSIGGEGTLARFDLTLTVWNSTNGLGGTLLYNAGLFNAATITRMVGQLITLLHTVAARPDIRLAELMEVLAEGERRYDSAEESELQEVNLGKLKRIRRRAVGGGTRLDEGAGR